MEHKAPGKSRTPIIELFRCLHTGLCIQGKTLSSFATVHLSSFSPPYNIILSTKYMDNTIRVPLFDYVHFLYSALYGVPTIAASPTIDLVMGTTENAYTTHSFVKCQRYQNCLTQRQSYPETGMDSACVNQRSCPTLRNISTSLPTKAEA